VRCLVWRLAGDCFKVCAEDSKMREIVHLQAGQCGNQIGAKVSVEENLRTASFAASVIPVSYYAPFLAVIYCSFGK